MHINLFDNIVVSKKLINKIGYHGAILLTEAIDLFKIKEVVAIEELMDYSALNKNDFRKGANKLIKEKIFKRSKNNLSLNHDILCNLIYTQKKEGEKDGS